MTLSGPILGLNKRWKLKLHSKLQPACSRAVYQQFARNQRFKKKGWIVFLHSSVVVLLFFQRAFVLMIEELLSLEELKQGR